MAPDLLSTICDEIDQRLKELRPLLAEYEYLLGAAGALDEGSATRPHAADAQTATAPHRRAAKPKPKPERAARGAAREAILGALEHGSHTVAELAVVTAMSGPNISGNLRRLALEGVVVKTEREGKTAWSLTEPAF